MIWICTWTRDMGQTECGIRSKIDLSISRCEILLFSLILFFFLLQIRSSHFTFVLISFVFQMQQNGTNVFYLFISREISNLMKNWSKAGCSETISQRCISSKYSLVKNWISLNVPRIILGAQMYLLQFSHYTGHSIRYPFCESSNQYGNCWYIEFLLSNREVNFLFDRITQKKTSIKRFQWIQWGKEKKIPKNWISCREKIDTTINHYNIVNIKRINKFYTIVY